MEFAAGIGKQGHVLFHFACGQCGRRRQKVRQAVGYYRSRASDFRRAGTGVAGEAGSRAETQDQRVRRSAVRGNLRHPCLCRAALRHRFGLGGASGHTVGADSSDGEV